MSRNELPASVQKLIESHLQSAADVEVILLLHRTEREWTGLDVARELRIDDGQAAEILARLRRRRLLSAAGERYRYSPRTAALDEAVTTLARIYPTYRVAIVAHIYAHPSWPITDFSDAFRLRKED